MDSTNTEMRKLVVLGSVKYGSYLVINGLVGCKAQAERLLRAWMYKEN